MAKIQHLYTGFGNPNDNPELVLTGEAVGSHLYSDLENSSSWMALSKADGESVVHNRWVRLNKGDGPDLAVTAVMQVEEIGTYEFGQTDIDVRDGVLDRLSWRNYQGIYTVNFGFSNDGTQVGSTYFERRLVISLGADTFEGTYYGSGSGSFEGSIGIDQGVYDALPRSGELVVKVEFW